MCFGKSQVANFFLVWKIYRFAAPEKRYWMNYTRKMAPSTFDDKNVSKDGGNHVQD
jgi:hypothetical protein